MSQKPFSNSGADGGGGRNGAAQDLTAPLGELDLDLRQVWNVIRRRRKIVTACVVATVAVAGIVVFALRPVYQAKALILIEKVGPNTLEHDGIAVDAVQDDYYQTQYTILQSRTLADKVMADLGLIADPEYAGGDPVEALRRSITVSPVRRTRLVYVAVDSLNPARAALVANRVVQRYIEQNAENRIFVSRDLLRSLDSKGATNASIESLPAVVNNPLIQQLKGLLATLEGQYAEQSLRYQPQHPAQQQLQAHIRQVRDQIAVEVRHIADSIRLQLSGEFIGSNVRIVDPARPPTVPDRPRKGRTLELALLLGLAAGFGLALLVDRLDLTVRSAEDAESLLRLPCLGMLQHLGDTEVERGSRYEHIWGAAHSQAAEAFRNLRTAVSFRLATVQKTPVILVTSAVQEEGKSFVAANLARAFAHAGEKVLLIDGDLRRPAVKSIFGLQGDHGLSNYLSNGSGRPAVQDAGIANLTMLSCGPIPDNPSELLGDPKLNDLITWAQEHYSRIIVDSPPVFPVTDALLWIRHAHGVVVVVRAGSTRAALVGRAVHRLKDGFANIVGIVLNRSSVESLEYYRYYHGYYAEHAKEKTAAS